MGWKHADRISFSVSPYYKLVTIVCSLKLLCWKVGLVLGSWGWEAGIGFWGLGVGGKICTKIIKLEERIVVWIPAAKWGLHGSNPFSRDTKLCVHIMLYCYLNCLNCESLLQLHRPTLSELRVKKHSEKRSEYIYLTYVIGVNYKGYLYILIYGI